MKRHRVNTKHPRYKTPYYERGRGRLWGMIPPERIEFPLDDPEEAERAVGELEQNWDSATVYEKQRMAETLKQSAIQGDRLLKSRQTDDPQEMMRISQTTGIYGNAYQAYLARLEMEIS
ncbi:MAG: hypothetical protein ACTSPB_24965 [Candidatus Thorarchaeota archaeon]